MVSKVAVILHKMHLVRRLILGTVVPYVRENKTIALWGKFPPKVKKFYCIGTAREYGKKERSELITMRKGYVYLVSVLPMPCFASVVALCVY